MTSPLRELIESLPHDAPSFDGSQFPLPITAAIHGSRRINTEDIRRQLESVENEDIKKQLEPALVAAEWIEGAQPDKASYFLKDEKVQSLVFTGSKWRAGWALILGGEDISALISALKEREFMIFVDRLDIEKTIYIGPRDTSPIYFLQLMVRFGMVWGKISPGESHKLEHYLEKDLPGLIFIAGDLPPLKYLIALGLMKLGAPAVVPSSFPFPYGRRVVADNLDEMLERYRSFTNLRTRFHGDEIIRLPEFCNPAYAQETLTGAEELAGTADSFFCVKPSSKPAENLEIIGKPNTGAGLGMLVEIAEPDFTDDIALTVEKDALDSINSIKGVKAKKSDDIFSLSTVHPPEKVPEMIREAVYFGLRLKYPLIRNIGVRFLFDPLRRKKDAVEIGDYRARRLEFVQSMTEDTTDILAACTECRPFSLEHTCILTPDRVPMCAARSYSSVKAAALFGSSDLPYQRRTDRSIPLRKVFSKGRMIDADKGEYESCNAVYSEMTDGRLNRVQLHSIRMFPHTSCGCFQNLAFWIEEVQGIGIMSRNADAVAPDGRTWSALANAAGGKQTAGIMGISTAYIEHPKFLKGDGGIANVVWMDSKLYAKFQGLFPKTQKVATEKDVRTVDELRNFVGRGFGA